MWRYLSAHSNHLDEVGFLSLETRFAVLLRAKNLNFLNSEVSAITAVDPIILSRSTIFQKLDTIEIYRFSIRTLAASTVFRHSAALSYLSYATNWSITHTTPLLNDLKYFALLYTRYGGLKEQIDLRPIFTVNFDVLNLSAILTLRSF